jgi:hypothetical protein
MGTKFDFHLPVVSIAAVEQRSGGNVLLTVVNVPPGRNEGASGYLEGESAMYGRASGFLGMFWRHFMSRCLHD